MSVFATSPRLPKPLPGHDSTSFHSYSSFAPKPYTVNTPRQEQELTLPHVSTKTQGAASGSHSARGAPSENSFSGTAGNRSLRSARSTTAANSTTAASATSKSHGGHVDADTASLKESPAALLYCSPRHRAKLAATHEERQASQSTSTGYRSSSRRFMTLLTNITSGDRTAYLGHQGSTGGYAVAVDNGVLGLHAPRAPTVGGKVDIDRKGGPPTSTKGTFSHAGRPSVAPPCGDTMGPKYNVQEAIEIKREKERDSATCISAAFGLDTKPNRPRFVPNAGKDDATANAPSYYVQPTPWTTPSHHKNLVGEKKKKSKFKMS